MESDVIVKCEIKKCISDQSLMGVFVWYDENGDWELLFTYYPNELTFDNDEITGLTKREALDLHWQRDLEYFRENDGEINEHEYAEY